MGGYGVDMGCGVGDVAEPVDELVAPLEQLGGFVAGDGGCVGGGEVVFGALDGGGALAAVGIGGADVLCRGQVVGEDGEQGVGRVAAIGGGDKDQFGVGGGGGLGEPAQLFCL